MRRQKRIRFPSPSSSECDSLKDNSDDEFLAEEVSDSDEGSTLSNIFQRFDELSEQEHSEDEDTDDIPLSIRVDQMKKKLNFVENANFVPKVHPFIDNNCGLQNNCGLNNNSSCIEIFKAFVPEECVDMITCQSNLYKEKKITDLKNSNKFRKNSRLNKCDDITVDELYAFQALTILMGITKKPHIEMYWSSDAMIETPIFSKIMPLRRFQTILSLLHFSEETESTDKLYKIRPIIEYLIDRFQSIYRPGEKISIDESLMKFQGKLSFKQFNRNKRARFGLKFYETCDSNNGYIYNFKIYVGKYENDSNEKSPHGKSGKVVIEMIGDLEGQGRSLYVDNWYSSPKLFSKLHDEKTNVCGTIRKNRTHLPKINTKIIKKGEVKKFSSSQMTFIAWKDKKVVTMLSTMHSPEMITTDKIEHHNKQNKVKPNIVLDYNNSMGGVDLSDQYTTSYEIIRKSKKWYKKTFFHLLDMTIFNAFVVYNVIHVDIKIKFLDFRMRLAKELIEKHGYTLTYARKKRFSHESPIRFANRHYPAAIVAGEKSVRKRCALCYTNKKTKWVTTMCDICNNIPLCVIPCFKNYHTHQNQNE